MLSDRTANPVQTTRCFEEKRRLAGMVLTGEIPSRWPRELEVISLGWIHLEYLAGIEEGIYRYRFLLFSRKDIVRNRRRIPPEGELTRTGG